MRDKLENALGNCKNSQYCKCNITNSFEVTTSAIFFIADDDNSTTPVKIVSDPDYWQLQVLNPVNKELCLVKIDNCLVTSHKTQKCDCILYSAGKCCLVEIKTATNKTRKDRRRDAILQLGATVDLLRSNGIDTSDHNINAVICFKNSRPVIVNAASNAARATFLFQYGIQLEEKNTIEF
jgi:hypothetical protein